LKEFTEVASITLAVSWFHLSEKRWSLFLLCSFLDQLQWMSSCPNVCSEFEKCRNRQGG